MAASESGLPGSTPPTRVHALLAAHNRRDMTIRCLESLDAQERSAGVKTRVVLVDDGSTDGTAAAVRERFPNVLLIQGSGHLYWNGAMRRAFEAAMDDDPDFFLLLNDDTHLYPEALARMVETHRELTQAGRARCLIVGSTIDPATGRQSYGGWLRGGGLLPGRMRLAAPAVSPVPCDTINGNCVLIPRDVVARVGMLDPIFTHRMGDIDYGFRASRGGCSLWVAPGYIGECSENSGKGLWFEKSISGREHLRRILGPKGLPPREWAVFTYRHYGPLWPASFLWPYLRAVGRVLKDLVRRR